MRSLPVDIEFGPAKAASKLRKNGVRFAEAEQALRDPNAATEDPDSLNERRFVALGMDALGRIWGDFTPRETNLSASFSLPVSATPWHIARPLRAGQSANNGHCR